MKPLNEENFSLHTPTRKYSKTCKSCLSKQKVAKLKGISFQEYLELEEAHGDRCAICGIPADEVQDDWTRHSPLALDHCHDTGKIRGFLCRTCNVGIGMLKDDPELLLKAAAYILKHRT